MKLLKILRQAQDKQNGFTLVELLIVIALIAILSVAVLATINPIEQSNKARDAKFKNDAAEVLNAYERYYASQNNYPWNSESLAFADKKIEDTVSGFVLSSIDPRFGVTSSVASSSGGLLISTSELKNSFLGKEPFDGTSTIDDPDAMYVYYKGGSTYVCFCPKAKANRVSVVGSGLKCGVDVTSVGDKEATTGKLYNVGEDMGGGLGICKLADDSTAIDKDFCVTERAVANLMCVPEGAVF